MSGSWQNTCPYFYRTKYQSTWSKINSNQWVPRLGWAKVASNRGIASTVVASTSKGVDLKWIGAMRPLAFEQHWFFRRYFLGFFFYLERSDIFKRRIYQLWLLFVGFESISLWLPCGSRTNEHVGIYCLTWPLQVPTFSTANYPQGHPDARSPAVFATT